MKLNIFSKLSLMLLVLPLAHISLSQAAKSTKPVSTSGQSEVKAATKLIEEFLDVNKNPQKNFEQYINDLIKILKPNPKYVEVCAKLENIKSLKKHTTVSVQLLKLKTLLPENIYALMKKHGAGTLLKILKARVK